MNDKINPESLLKNMFLAAIESAQPHHSIPKYLPNDKKGKLIVIGAGKASAAMAKAVEDNWEGELSGVVVTRYGYAVPCQHIDIMEAAHPVPDEAGLSAAKRMLSLVSHLSAEDTVLCLISGGGSSLLTLPFDGISLDEKKAINRELLRSGATIGEMNCVRRHLSAIKGGRLAAACYPARLVTLMISDVPGDDPRDIASGPTVGDPSTCEDALDIIRRYGISLPEHIVHILKTGLSESLKPGDMRLNNSEVHLISTPQLALESAAAMAVKQGISAHILGDSIEGEARDVGKVMAGIARQVALHDQPFRKPCVILSGGETTVTVRGNGRGGRNVEYLLALAIQLNGLPGIYALAGDTDGVDGQEEIAGAWLSPQTLKRAAEAGLNARDALNNNDGHGFFAALDDSIITGPTLTNVNDFRCVLVI
ncbi:MULTISPECIES: glycerate kinase [unclassified Raoultella]|uniref:glycerate kinase type-2 family protein n=1 Tax=unclassified Raoultella TaxID=2627600 RepID=UPI0013578D19|nr:MULTISPECIES: glycerate kinase [unclassified Raoultella]